MVNKRRAALFAALFSLAADVATAQTMVPSDFRFPRNQAAEAFSGKATVVDVRFKFYFPFDEHRYLPVNDQIAAALSSAPVILAPKGMKAVVLSTVCTPEQLLIEERGDVVEVKGGRIESQIEITPDTALNDGTRQIALEYLLLDLIFAKIAGRKAERAQVFLDIRLWPSAAAKEAAMRAEEEKRRAQAAIEERQRREEEAAREAEARAEAVAAAQASAARRARFIRQALPYLGGTLLIAILIILNRNWLFPDVTVALGPGQHVQKSLSTRRLDGETTADPGTILQTSWARSWIGLRKRIKVETFVSEDAPADPERAPIDILVSAGSSVPAGRYLAKTRRLTVRIDVSASPAAA